MARGKAGTDGLNKMDLVRQALEALPAGKPKELQAHIKQHSGLDLKTTMISSYKAQLRKKGGGEAEAAVAVRDLTALKGLIVKLGAPQVQQLIRVLSK